MTIQQRDIDIKRENIPCATDLTEVYALIKRVAGEAYAARIALQLTDEDDGFDSYTVCDREEKILLSANSGVGLAAGFNAYLKERCGYSIGALTTGGTLPQTPPAVGEPIRGKSKFLYRYFFNYCT